MPLPKIRFSSLPRPVWEHILARVAERQISLQDLRRLQDWVNTGPWAPMAIGTRISGHLVSAVPANFRKQYWRKAWPPSALESSIRRLGAGTAALAWADPTRGTYRVFSKGRIANLALKNRLVRAAAAEGAFPNGEMVDGGIELYRGLARGGAGLIILGTWPSRRPDGRRVRRPAYTKTASHPRFARLREVAHANGNGCKIVAQLNHAGMQSRLFVSPSALRLPSGPNRQNKPGRLQPGKLRRSSRTTPRRHGGPGTPVLTASNSTRRMATSSTPCSPPLPTTGPTSTAVPSRNGSRSFAKWSSRRAPA